MMQFEQVRIHTLYSESPLFLCRRRYFYEEEEGVVELQHKFQLFHFVFFILVGNKNDDPNSKVVETADAQKFAEQMDIRLFETSAKENINVEDVSPVD